ncbi:TIGR03943 family putative permease subunit [Marininema halotolerans]|uniref:TIGR03943 family protein n=1 Tax=Marininema halotolerans TaxID=1155944 RepID=A0A1I6UUA5_9BACL|nr:TIGR03943 family protein [Marininema halotolerans]SFT05015.1 TIGR03943 family protein [Marininema halotolerans]
MGAITRVFITFSMALMMIELQFSHRLQLLVNPKVTPFILISILVLILLGLVQIWEMRRTPAHPVSGWGYLFLLLPLLFFLFIPPRSLDSTMAAKKEITYASAVIPPQATGSVKKKPHDSNPHYNKVLQDLMQQRVITLNPDNYVDRMTTIQLHAKELVGKTIRVQGFVHYAKEEPNKLIVARYVVTCCIADASVVGFPVEIPRGTAFKEGTWIEVTGTLSTTTIESRRMPQIEGTEVRQISEPKNAYVYANF